MYNRVVASVRTIMENYYFFNYKRFTSRVCVELICVCLVIDDLTRHVQDEIPWYFLFTGNIVLMMRLEL